MCVRVCVMDTLVGKDIYVLISGICEYINLHGKGDFADVIKIILDYLGGPNVITSFLTSERGRLGGQRRRYNDGGRYQSDVIVAWETSSKKWPHL